MQALPLSGGRKRRPPGTQLGGAGGRGGGLGSMHHRQSQTRHCRTCPACRQHAPQAPRRAHPELQDALQRGALLPGAVQHHRHALAARDAGHVGGAHVLVRTARCQQGGDGPRGVAAKAGGARCKATRRRLCGHFSYGPPSLGPPPPVCACMCEVCLGSWAAQLLLRQVVCTLLPMRAAHMCAAGAGAGLQQRTEGRRGRPQRVGLPCPTYRSSPGTRWRCPTPAQPRPLRGRCAGIG